MVCLKDAYKNEKDSQVKVRIAAVNMVFIHDDCYANTTECLMQSVGWAYKWMTRFENGGMKALRDQPRTGRPPRVSPERITKIIKSAEDGIITPKKLCSDIHEKAGVWYHPVSIRREMNKRNMSPKTPELVHRNKA